MKATKGKFEDLGKSNYEPEEMEGDELPPVVRPAPMGKAESYPGAIKLSTTDDETRDIMREATAKSGPSGNMKIDPKEEPGPVIYGAAAAKPKASGLKIPMSELAGMAAGKSGTSSDAGVLNTVAAKKRPFKKGPSKY